MTFILISGDTNKGKTSVCNKLHDMIALNTTFKVHNKLKSQTGTAHDFIAHYEKNKKHIVLNSASDHNDCMIEFCQYLDNLAANGVRPDIIITSVRAKNAQYFQTSRIVAILDAFAKGTKKIKVTLEDYFKQIISNMNVFELTSLKHHVFVLHLDRQEDDGENDSANALAPYWDDNADKAKYALDFALARLEA